MSEPVEETPRPSVRVERRGGTAIWVIDRADRMNALSRSAVRELHALARQADGDPSIRAVVITGSGEKAFCAGADLKERRSMSEEDVRDFLSLYRESFGAIDRLGVPTIAAINGVAFGGGLELALACDFRILASHAQIGLTETSLGIIPGAGGTQRLTRLVGVARAKEMILLAQRLTSEVAFTEGLVHRIAVGPVLEEALRFAEPFSSAAPIALRAALEAIDAAAETSMEQGLTIERRCYERTLSSQDRLEALAAFAEKRPPVFRGI